MDYVYYSDKMLKFIFSADVIQVFINLYCQIPGHLIWTSFVIPFTTAAVVHM